MDSKKYRDLINKWKMKLSFVKEIGSDEFEKLIPLFEDPHGLVYGFVDEEGNPKNKAVFENAFGENGWASLLKTYFILVGLHVFDFDEKGVLYRARLFEEKLPEKELEERVNGTFLSKSPFFGYDSKGSGAPSPEQVKKAGRCNPIGISYLYASSSAPCAANEVIEGPCGYVSVAEMKVRSPLLLLDLSSNVSDAYGKAEDEEDPSMKKRVFMRGWLCRFIHFVCLRFADLKGDPAEEDPYPLCQTIAKAVFSLGLDGIAFRTSKGYFVNEFEGLNYVFFDRFAAEATSSKLYRAPLKEDDSFLRLVDADFA